MKTTIYLKLIEEIQGDRVIVLPPLNGTMTQPRLDLADVFNVGAEGVEIPAKDPTVNVSCDLAKLDERVHYIANKNGAKCSFNRPKLTWKITRTLKPSAGVYPFPPVSGNGTKWGATDFYDCVKEELIKAIRSGQDFETPWLSCKKDLMSSRVSRNKNTVMFEVSVTDDFDTFGMGVAKGRILHKGRTDEQIMASLEKLGNAASNAAAEDKKGNEDYIGWSVGPDEKPYPWVLTYLVNAGESDIPSGDYYHWWGWQETKDEGQLPDPEEIPADIAEELAAILETFPESPVIHRGYRATTWK